MARIAGVDLPRQKRVEIALTYIYGIGVTRSNKILKCGYGNKNPSAFPVLHNTHNVPVIVK